MNPTVIKWLFAISAESMALLSFVILITYTAYYLLRVGLLPSHSDSYLEWCAVVYLGYLDDLLLWLASDSCNGCVGSGLLFAKQEI